MTIKYDFLEFCNEVDGCMRGVPSLLIRWIMGILPSMNFGTEMLAVAFRLILNTRLGYIFLIFSAVNIAIMTAPSLVMNKVSNSTDIADTHHYIMILVFLGLGQQVWNIVFQRIKIKLSIVIQKMYNAEKWQEYEQLSFSSMQRVDVFEYKQVKHQSVNGMRQLISWGAPHIFQLVSSIVGCLVVFVSNDVLYIGFIMVIINLVGYVLILRPIQRKISEYRQAAVDIDDVTNSKTRLLLPLFMHKYIGKDDIVDIEAQSEIGWEKFQLEWIYYGFVMGLLNQLIFIWFIFQSDITPVTFMMLYTTMTNFSNAVTSVSQFLNQYNEILTNYEKCENKLKRLDRQMLPEQHQFPESGITTYPVNLTLDNSGYSIVGPSISILPRSKTLVVGESGAGKTSVLMALIGMINGILFAHTNLSPIELFKNWTIFYQKIKQFFPVGKISIREIFDNAPDETIYQFLDLVSLSSAIRRLNNPDDNLPDNLPNDPLAVQLNNVLSGGETTRLALAYVLWLFGKHDTAILALDEIEQGCDPELAYNIISRILNRYQNKTIIIISHLEIIDNPSWIKQKYKCDIRWDNIIRFRKQDENTGTFIIDTFTS